MKPVTKCATLAVLLTSAALLTACGGGPAPIVTYEPVCPDRVQFTPEQANRIADRIEALEPDDPLIPYVIASESTNAQLDEVCP